ncbi:MAG: hypothetical protein V3R72_12695 [Gammaproteobacteria bacterium]
MEHQLAAILYADVAGYSRLTGLDEEETHRKLDASLNLLSDVIAAHGGQKIHEAGMPFWQSSKVSPPRSIPLSNSNAECLREMQDWRKMSA